MIRRLRLAITLSIALLGVLPPVAGGAGLWGGARPDPMTGRTPLDETDSQGLPNGWKFKVPDVSGIFGREAGATDITLDPGSGRVRESYQESDVELRAPMVAPLAEYDSVVTARTVRTLWRQKTRGSRSVARATSKPAGGLFRVEVPIQFPKTIRSIVGEGGPSLEVSGSETISLQGTSNWTVRESGFDTERRRQSAFPSLEMKQDLAVNVTGSIGDKIRVDLDQSSNVTTSIDNKVKLRYEGDDDDVIKLVDLGNTNLSLQGASFRQEGLFGIKTVAKLGNVDLVTIASKQEGKTETARFTPSGDKRRVTIRDLDYIRRTYFFVADSAIQLDRATLQVYRDNLNPADNQFGTSPAKARLDPTAPPDSATNPEFTGNFNRLIPGEDYVVITPWLVPDAPPGIEIPVIRLLRGPLGPSEALAVAYVHKRGGSDVPVGDESPAPNPALAKGADSLLLKMIKPRIDDIATDPMGRFDPGSPWYPTLVYELRNFYDLTARNIAGETLNLVVRRIDASQAVDPEAVQGKPLVEILGLDQRGRAGSDNPDHPDGRLDDNYLDEESGILFFPDLHPFDPDTLRGPCLPAAEYAVRCIDDPARNTLRGNPADPPNDFTNPNVYYQKTPNPATETRYYVDAEFLSSQQGYFLGRFNLLENSEQVKIDGILQKSGVDYSIDYDTGQLNFTRAPGPDQVVTVDYSFAPGIGQVQRTLLGFSSSYTPGVNSSFSSSMLFESRGAQELNPKLGEEPARSIVGDVASVLTFRPSWMTQAANVIPGVHTNQASTLNLQGNMAISLPNPNTKGEAYLDDMEGNRESNTISLSRLQWLWSGVPLDSLGTELSRDPTNHALVRWFNARGVKERDLKPVLTNEEGGDNQRTVLQIEASAPVGGSFSSATWTGITQSLSRTGDDLSKVRFVEIWVNDAIHLTPGSSATLHMDLGRVSEDAFWEATNPPNGRLDTEDKNLDTRLDADEDTGLDGLESPAEPNFSVENPDPNGDDYRYDLTNAPDDYSRINGTEGNGAGDPNARPDTEDLTLDGSFDTYNDYFTAAVNLADSTFVAIDVAQLYAGDPDVRPGNGWRLFRLPISGGPFRGVGTPNWSTIKHARFWLSGMSGPTQIQIGGIELVGNRWLARALTPEQVVRQVELDVRARNNKDDAGIYEPPYEVDRASGGSATRREQSLALGYTRLAEGDTLLAFKTFGDAGGGLGYTQYRELRLYVHGDLGVEAQKLLFLARFGPDTLHYYEYAIPVRSGWQDVRIPLELLSRLKERGGTERVKVDSLTGAAEGIRYTVVGNPSFTRISRISFGVSGLPGAPESSGEIWVDELRLAEVRKERGSSSNVTVQANFADVLALNTNIQRQDQDFFRVGSGTNQGTGLNHTQVSLSSTFQADRLLPTSGLQLPVRFAYQRTNDVPKYRTGSDVVLDDARSDLETRQSTRQSVDFSYRRTGPRKGWTRYTLDALGGNASYSKQGSVNPSAKDSSWAFQTNATYDLPIGGGPGLTLSKRTRLKFLPELVGFTVAWRSSRNLAYARKVGDVADTSSLRSDTKTRLLTLGWSTSYIPLPFLTSKYTFTSQRNMLVHQEGPLGNKGTEVDQSRRMEVTIAPRNFLYMSPTLGLAGSYHENARPELRITGSDPLGLKSVDNRGSARATTSIPLRRLAERFGARASARPDTGRGRSFTPAPVRFLFSRLQDIQTSFTFERGASVSRVLGDPGLAYKTGFTAKPASSLRRITNSNIASSRSFTTSASTTLRPVETLTLDFRADHRLAFADANLGARRNLTISWPDVGARWLELQRPLGAQNLLNSLMLSSHYSYKTDESGPEDRPVEIRNKTNTWAPLLGWQATFRNGISADVSTAFTRTRNVDERSFSVTRDMRSTNHDIRLIKRFPAAKGLRLPWSKNRIRLANDLNLNLTVGIQRTRQATSRAALSGENVEVDTQRLNVNSGSSYNFTRAISAGFNLGFSQNKDYKTAITQRGLNIALNGQFRF